MAKRLKARSPLQDVVYSVLLNNFAARDDFGHLFAGVLPYYGDHTTSEPHWVITKAQRSGEIPQYEAIDRARRLVQKAYPETRGKLFEERQKYSKVKAAEYREG